jgi:hypothetical protein
MQIQFRKSIAHERGSFTAGQIVTVRTLPMGWQQWLTGGVIKILPEDQTEIAIADPEPERAVSRRTEVPQPDDRVRGDGAKPRRRRRGARARQSE